MSPFDTVAWMTRSPKSGAFGNVGSLYSAPSPLGLVEGRCDGLDSLPVRVSGRDVAQPGSAPEWGSGGRGFKSRRPDCCEWW
jgi:hypothetical protein